MEYLDLPVEPADHVVRRVRHLLDLHQADKRVHLRRKQQMQSVRVVAERDAHTRGDQRPVDALVDVDDVLPLGVDFHEDLVLAHDLILFVFWRRRRKRSETQGRGRG